MSEQYAPGLQDFDFMEIDSIDGIDVQPEQMLQLQLSNTDPNLYVTSAPEQLDTVPDFIDLTDEPGQTTPSTAAACQAASEDSAFLLAELGALDDADMLLLGASQVECSAATAPDFSVSGGCDVSLGIPIQKELCSVPLMNSWYSGPATVTLVKPQQQQQFTISSMDQITNQLMQELYKEEPVASDQSWGKQHQQHRRPIELCLYGGKATKASVMRQSQPPSDAASHMPNLPMFEPLASTKPATVQTPAFDLVSPTESVDTSRFSCASSDDAASTGGSVMSERDSDIERMAAYIRVVIEKRSNKPDDMSSKLKVHEVILVILLNSTHGDKSKGLQRILAFCDENGRESTVECRHFKTLDTETMGLLWQKIKRNTKGNYDTFARAMRVRRERSEGFFEYLDAGKGKKKRIYRFGSRSLEEMARFKKTLREVSKPQACSY